jgi:hypothetical protein
MYISKFEVIKESDAYDINLFILVLEDSTVLCSRTINIMRLARYSIFFFLRWIIP